jgi:signal transduction histidine kinase
VETLFYLRLIALTTGTVVYLFLIALILGNRRPRTFERILFSLVLALFFIYAGGLLEMNARIEYAFAPNAARMLYSLLIVTGTLFLPALLVHTHLQFYEMAAPGTAPPWAKVLVLAPLYVAPALSFIVLFFAARPPTRMGVRFGPRFGPLDQMASRLVRLFPWTPEATFLFVGILLSLAIDLGILNLKPKIGAADRRFFKWMAGISAALMALLMATQSYRRFETQQIEALGVALIVAGLLPGVLLGYYALRHNFLDFGKQRNLVYALSATELGEIDRLSGNATELPQFSRSAENGRQLEAIRVAREAAEVLRRKAERRGVHIEFEDPRSELFVHAPEDALNELLANLLMSAVEAQPDGGRVRVGVTRHNGDAEFVIQDDGPGITSETRETVLDRFYPTNAAGTVGPFSIIVRRAAEIGAQVTYESPDNNGRGTRFRLRVPVAASD